MTGDIIREVGDRYYVRVWGTKRMFHVSLRYDDVWESNWLELYDGNLERSAAMLRRAADELDKIDLKELPE